MNGEIIPETCKDVNIQKQWTPTGRTNLDATSFRIGGYVRIWGKACQHRSLTIPVPK